MKVTIVEQRNLKKYQTGDVLELQGGVFVQIHCYSIDYNLRYYLSYLDGYGKLGRDDFKHMQSFTSMYELMAEIERINPIVKHYSKDDYEIKIVPKNS